MFLPTGSFLVPFGGFPSRILNISHEKELLWSLWVSNEGLLWEALGSSSPSS